MFQTVYTNPPSSDSYLATREHRCFMWRVLMRHDAAVAGPYVRPEVLQTMMDKTYDNWQAPDAQHPSFGVGVPATGFRNLFE
jgi:hypothetical protein